MGLLDGIFGAGASQALVGTSEDEMYRNHINHLRAHEDELMRQKYANAAQNQYSQNLAQSMVNTKSAMLQNAYNQAQTTKPFNPNEQGAFKIPLSQLVTLWQAKYGDEWVEVFEDEFWSDAMSRLKVADKLENTRHWFRIKEDA